jgi:hypothetical protein
VPLAVSLEGEHTWYGTVGTLVRARCSLCHRAGEIGPFPLETFEQVSAVLPLVRDAVATRRMPPFPPEQSEESGCPKIDDGRQLSEDERAFLLAWIDAGAPEGTRRELPRAEPFRPLGEPSEVWQMREPFTTAGTGDEYRCFLVEPTHVAAIPVSAISAQPGTRAIVHHASVYLVPPNQLADVRRLERSDDKPGYECFGGVGVDLAIPAGFWVPGNDAPLVPPRPGVGYFLPVGWGLVMQNHYNSQSPTTDRSSIALWRGSFVFPEVPHAGIFGDMSFTLAAGTQTTVETNVPVRPAGSPYALLNEVNAGSVYAVWAHMHLLGKSMELDLLHADGTQQCLLRIPRWDFHWQGLYRLQAAVPARAGDTVRLRCHFDNPTSDDVHYGERTADEMCFGTISLTDP